MFGVDISCLVDTGVDGIPLKVHGATIFPLTIGGLKFQHKLIVADKITADAILGLDFLDSQKCVLDLGLRKLCVKDTTLPSISITPVTYRVTSCRKLPLYPLPVK